MTFAPFCKIKGIIFSNRKSDSYATSICNGVAPGNISESRDNCSLTGTPDESNDLISPLFPLIHAVKSGFRGILPLNSFSSGVLFLDVIRLMILEFSVLYTSNRNSSE